MSAFTGERLPGGGDAEFGVDMARHMAAYDFAATRAPGKSVLDAGCGEGYGAARLADAAREVVGVDRIEPITVARARHRHPRLRFEVADLEHLEALGRQFDLVVSFQVIEHLPDPVGYLRALAARIAPGGEMIVTTPNRLMSVSENPYHLREWTAPELLALAAPVLPGVRVEGMNGSARVLAYERARGEQVRRILRLDPLGLRNLVPGFIVRGVFPRLARLVRRRIGAGAAMPDVGPADFSVHGRDLEHALDLVLLARPGGSSG
ncbi:MAG TPA: methyltransferase domain-containing protein [Candidatus Eisenbacteria bacterium]|nr:methyltransferase domain-containing protein [Candidatus Eisenbacteria bacterium]